MGPLVNKRVRTLWLPGLAAVILAQVLPRILFWGELLSGWWIMIRRGPLWLSFFLPWLWGLVAVGGLGAYWSRRAGGGVRERVLASLFPALVQLVHCAAIPHYPWPGEPRATWGAHISAYINLVVAPSIFLLVGTIPFLGSGQGKKAAP